MRLLLRSGLIMMLILGMVRGTAHAENLYDFSLLGNALNPDISAIGDFGYTNGIFSLNEIELAVQAPVDPYHRADAFIRFPGGEGAVPEIEEGYVTLLALPGGLQAKLGKFKADLGWMNRLHAHNLPSTQLPFFLTTYFGPEGLRDSGASLSWLVPNPWDIYSELRGEAINGTNDVSFSANARDTITLYRWKSFLEVGEDGGLAFGLTSIQGKRGANSERTTSFLAGDMRYKWKPSKHQGFTLAGEYLASRQDIDTKGYYLIAKGNMAQEWEVGYRYDYSESPGSTDATTGSSVFFTVLPTEFAFYRVEGNWVKLAGSTDVNSTVTFQVNYSIGAHGAHEF